MQWGIWYFFEIFANIFDIKTSKWKKSNEKNYFHWPFTCCRHFRIKFRKKNQYCIQRLIFSCLKKQFKCCKSRLTYQKDKKHLIFTFWSARLFLILELAITKFVEKFRTFVKTLKCKYCCWSAKKDVLFWFVNSYSTFLFDFTSKNEFKYELWQYMAWLNQNIWYLIWDLYVKSYVL